MNMSVANRNHERESSIPILKHKEKQQPLPSTSSAGRFRRLGKMVWVMLYEALRFLQFSRMGAEERQKHLHIPQHMVASLLDLGPTFIKLGQMMSTRPDFLPQEYVRELQRLQDDVPPFSFKEVEVIIQQELGREIPLIFETFNRKPVAAASLAQVHLAVLKDGSKVAVKIQRPLVQESISRDLEILSVLVRFFSKVFPKRIGRLNLVNGFHEFKRYTLQELDFIQEARVLMRFKKNFRDWPDVVFPEVDWRHTTTRILTMSRVTGKRLQDHMATLSPVERKRLNARLLEIEMKMFVSDGLFHADLHPGNIFFQEDGKVALLDFGMYGEISEKQRDHFVLYFLAIVQKQVRRAFYHLTSMTERQPGADEEAYYHRFKGLAEAFFRSTLIENSLTQVYLQIILAGAQYGFIFPSDLLLHAKAVTTAEALTLMLAPDLKFEEEARQSVIRQFVDRALDMRRIKAHVERILPELLIFGELPPASLSDEEQDQDLSDRLWREVGLSVTEKTRLWKASVEWLPHVLKPFVRIALEARYSSGEIDGIIENMKEKYGELEPGVPQQASVGGELMVHLAAFTIAMFNTLLDYEHSKEDATRLVYDIAWRAYAKMGEIPWVLGARFSQDGYRRLHFSVDAFLTFPFSSPAYQWEKIDAGAEVYAFDMLRCPVAEYFRSHGLEQLCVNTWCNLDFPLARQWGSRLERAGTLAGGAERCDFRWRWLSETPSTL